jgi:hypothetical protein
MWVGRPIATITCVADAELQVRQPRRQVKYLVYARHGRELMGCKSPVYEAC